MLYLAVLDLKGVVGKAKGGFVKTQEETGTEHGSLYTGDEATDRGGEPAILDQEAIGRLAYYYWEERGCPIDSPCEDWFRAESELRNRIASASCEETSQVTERR